MPDHATTARLFWELIERRDWEAFSALLAPDVVYETPQTRERVRGREAVTRFNREYPGDWHIAVERVVADADGAACWLDASVDGDSMIGIAFLTFDEAGAVSTVVDFWPEPYEPSPSRAHLVERY